MNWRNRERIKYNGACGVNLIADVAKNLDMNYVQSFNCLFDFTEKRLYCNLTFKNHYGETLKVIMIKPEHDDNDSKEYDCQWQVKNLIYSTLVDAITDNDPQILLKQK